MQVANMMKRMIMGAIAALWLCMVSAQQTITIEGTVKNGKSGACLLLFKMQGDVGKSVASDTLRGGTFRFELPSDGEPFEEFNMLYADGDVYSMGLRLWAKPGETVRVDGQDMNIYTWRVQSSLPQQQTWNRFIDHARPWLDQLQPLGMASKRLSRTYRAKTDWTEAQRTAIFARRDSLERITDSLRIVVDKQDIELMQQLPVDEVWLHQLMRKSMAVHYSADYPYGDEVRALYWRLDEAQRCAPNAQKAYEFLHPQKEVAVDDDAADDDLYDLEGKKHRLEEFKGKPVLLDFWSRGCGPCVSAMPEMKQLQELYGDRLQLVSISLDDATGWRQAIAEHGMTWYNLRDPKGLAGLCTRYGGRGIPRYVFISAQGKVVEMWSGYGKGSLLKRLEKLMK